MGIGRPMKRLLLVVLVGCAKGDATDSSAKGPESVVIISPEGPVTSDELVASARALLPLGDDWSMAYAWFRDGSESGHTEATVPAELTAKGEQWTVEVVSTDMNGAGPPELSDPVTILNTAPGEPILRPVPAVPREGVADLVCEVYQAAVDPDADTITYSMVWARNGETYSGTSSTTWPGDTVAAGQLIEGDVWRCTAQAFDGDAESPPAMIETTVSSVPPGFTPGGQMLSAADRWFEGEDTEDFFGYDVAATADMDGDGVDDLLVSGHRMEGSGRNTGRTFVMSGASLVTGTTTDPAAEAVWIIEGAAYFDFSGYAVDGIGDTDGDGLSDILISSHNSDELAFNSGSVALFTAASLGAPGLVYADEAPTRFIGESLRAYTGFSLASAGDVDGDGWPDVIIGAMGNLDRFPYEGKAYVVRHAEYADQSEVLLSERGTMLMGEHRRAYAGWAVSGAGDVDGDGLDDVLVGACGTEMTGAEEDEDEGKAYLVSGESMLGKSEFELSDADRIWHGDGFHAYVGYDVAGVGDVDGDGSPDIAVSAFLGDMYGNYPGGVYLFFGGDVAPSGHVEGAPVHFAADGMNDQFGREIGGQGDVDGDGRADLLIGAMTAGEGEEGMAVLWLAADIGTSGTHEAVDAHAQFFGGEEGSFLGSGLSISGDFNSDGRSDMAIGAHAAPVAGGTAGALGVFFTR